MSNAARGTPRIFIMLAVLLLVVPLGIAMWWWYRPTPEPLLKELVDPDIVCTGRVDTPGQVISLEPSVPGRVIEVFVKEGEEVLAGKPILQLDPAAAEHRLAQAAAALELARVDLDSAKSEAERFPKQIEGRQLLVKAAAARVEAAVKMLEQRKSQTITPIGRAEGEAMEAQVRELRLMETAQKAQTDDLAKLDPQMRVRAAQARLKAAEADHDLALRGVKDCTLKAPSAGIVLRLQMSAGGVISPGGYPSAVVFAPTGKLIIRAEVEQEYLGEVEVGSPVTVQDENLADGLTRKGKVYSLSKWIAPRRSILMEPGEINDVRTLECLIELNDAKGLTIGQRMRVRIQRR